MGVKIKWYSGYKGKEKPESFIIDDKEIIVNKVLKEEIVEDTETMKRKRIFLVDTDEGIFKLTIEPGEKDKGKRLKVKGRDKETDSMQNEK